MRRRSSIGSAAKSEQELHYMMRAAKIVENKYACIRDRVEAGMRKNDLIADIFHAGIAGTDEFGGDYPAIVPLAPSGEDATAAHLTWDDKPFERDACTFLRSRVVTVVITHRFAERCISESYLTMSNVRSKPCSKASGRIERRACRQPGGRRRPCAASQTLGAWYRANGTVRLSDWAKLSARLGERTISFRETDETELRPGMTFHFMPGLWMDSWGLEITETIVIEPAGPARPLADVPRNIVVKP